MMLSASLVASANSRRRSTPGRRSAAVWMLWTTSATFCVYDLSSRAANPSMSLDVYTHVMPVAEVERERLAAVLA